MPDRGGIQALHLPIGPIARTSQSVSPKTVSLALALGSTYDNTGI